ncbi:fimbrial protein [Erwinia sp. JH02]|uniref:fimbrial protein n=1 Tax=Erwinia sp. JH02 TaxID=2733394 RepID=UPI0014893106|nr:fimbrial protein [Erwinia sp. JH02]NNS07415.1 type 1 fimbrial protein [Erwinia sp. JH02]
MKKRLLATSMIAALALPVPAVIAANGTITFTGDISNTTCNVSVNGRNSSTTIVFEPISASALAKAGEVANEQPVILTLTNCQNPTENVRALFDSTETDSMTGNLKNKGSAANVQVQLMDNNRKPIKLGDGSQASGPSFKIVDDLATLNYFARYYATDKVEAGDVSTVVNYSLSYF